MIIVSQDRDVIVNFDRVESIWIDDNILDKTGCGFEIVAGEDILGEYETEERAKEVLMEIVNEYKECNRYKSGFVANRIYEMPKE